MVTWKNGLFGGLLLVGFAMNAENASPETGDKCGNEQRRTVAAQMIVADLGYFFKEARAQDWSDAEIARALQVTFNALNSGELRELNQLQATLLKDEMLYHRVMTGMGLIGGVAAAIVGAYLLCCIKDVFE